MKSFCEHKWVFTIVFFSSFLSILQAAIKFNGHKTQLKNGKDVSKVHLYIYIDIEKKISPHNMNSKVTLKNISL